FCHTFLVIGVARVFLGYHFPTDILAGMAIGMGCVALGLFPRVKALVAGPPMRWLDSHPRAFQTALCLLIALIRTTFEPFYPLVGFGLRSGGNLLHLLGITSTLRRAILVLGLLVVLDGLLILRRVWSPKSSKS